MQRNLATDMAPPFTLVAHYFIAASLFYALSAFILPFYAQSIDGYFLSTSIASLMHLYLLGFVMMVFFGAMYQLIPVILEVPIFSKDFAYIQFYVFIVGIGMFCFGLADTDYLNIMPYGAMLIYLSMLIFVINIFLTYKELKKWEIVAKFIFVANVFLLIGVCVGLFMALDLVYGFYGNILSLVKMHIATTVFGYIIMTIMGVGMVLLPMFSLSHGYSQKKIELAFYFISSGLAILLIGEVLHVSFVFGLGAVLSSVAILLAIWQMVEIFRARVRRQNDFWSKNMIASFFSLMLCLVVFILAVVTEEQKYFILFGFLLFFGFFIFFIIGHIYKILPFLVWYQRFSPLVGKIKVPMLSDMVKEKIADYQFWTTCCGLLISGLGIVLSIKKLFILGTLVMGFATFLVMYNIYFTLAFKPKEETNVK